MTDLEKVVKGLECCLSASLGETICPTCTYRYDENGVETGDCEINLLKDAIALLKAQEPRLVTEADFKNADEYGFIPAWYEGLVNKEGWWNCIPKEALETAKEDGCRYWTSKPSLKQMEETPWN